MGEAPPSAQPLLKRADEARRAPPQREEERGRESESESRDGDSGSDSDVSCSDAYAGPCSRFRVRTPLEQPPPSAMPSRYDDMPVPKELAGKKAVLSVPKAGKLSFYFAVYYAVWGSSELRDRHPQRISRYTDWHTRLRGVPASLDPPHTWSELVAFERANDLRLCILSLDLCQPGYDARRPIASGLRPYFTTRRAFGHTFWRDDATGALCMSEDNVRNVCLLLLMQPDPLSPQQRRVGTYYAITDMSSLLSEVMKGDEEPMPPDMRAAVERALVDCGDGHLPMHKGVHMCPCCCDVWRHAADLTDHIMCAYRQCSVHRALLLADRT